MSIKRSGWKYCSRQMPGHDHYIGIAEGGDAWSESRKCIVGILNSDGVKRIGIGTYRRHWDGTQRWEGRADNGEDLDTQNVIAWQYVPNLTIPPRRKVDGSM